VAEGGRGGAPWLACWYRVHPVVPSPLPSPQRVERGWIARNYALANEDGRVALINAVSLKIFTGHGSGNENRMRIDGNARTDPRPGPNPGAVRNGDGFYDQIERRQFVIMAAGAEKGALGNADIVPDGDPLQVQQPTFFTQPDVIADGQFPRERDFNLGLDRDPPADVRSKDAKHGAFQGGKTKRTEAKQKQADHKPGGFAQLSRAAIE
jgi:hypothetical protein